MSSITWVEGQFLSFSTGDIYLASDQWLACFDYDQVFLMFEFWGTGGSSLSVVVQTTGSENSDTSTGGWISVDTAVMSTTTKTMTLQTSGSPPLMGFLRLKFTAAAAVLGTLRVTAQRKVRVG